MAGSIPLSLQQVLADDGSLLSGGHVFFIQAGTVGTPQNAFQDAGLTLPWANPYVLLTTARLPLVYFADGYIKVRITDADGAQVFNQDNIPVTGFSSGGGGGGTIDPTTVIQTGWLQPIYGTGIVTGFVRANGRTLGNASSGATERANADTVALYAFLYNADPNLVVSSGRGANAAADYAANKTIALPDFRGRVIAGLDDMGNSAAGRRTVTYTGVAATVLGSVSTGLESHTMTAGESAALALTTVYSVNPKQYLATTLIPNVGSTSGASAWSSNAISSTTADLPTIGTMTTTSNAGGNPHSIVDPTIFITFYLKL